MEKRSLKVLLPMLACLLLLVIVFPLQAQDSDEPELTLRIRRDFGYGAGSKMQGRFSYRVSGPGDLQRVEFLMDGEAIGEATEPPFNYQFNTDQFALGPHTMSAVGYTAGGSVLMSNVVAGDFVSGQDAGRSTIIVVGGILLLVVGFRVASYYLTKQKGGSNYGMMGGAVCPNCGRPFSRHWWAFNLLTVRLDRCPHCKKWVSTYRATPEQLAAAEAFARELDESDEKPVIEEADQENAQRSDLDDSRYI